MSKTRQTCRELNEAEAAAIADIRQCGEDFLRLFELRGLQGREVALAKTKIEEAVMWAVKGVTGS